MAEVVGALRCMCAHAVYLALGNRGERVCTLLFFDDEPASETYGERVRECPSCGEQLGFHTLVGRLGVEGLG